eukprot:g7691.t1
MLAYEPGFVIRFDLVLTLVSLAIAFVSSIAAASLTAFGPRLTGAMTGGIVFGAGVSAMHFTGMSAIEFGGSLSWSRPLVLAAIAASAALAPLGFVLATGKGTKAAASSAAILSIAIVVMHFTAMGAAELTLDGTAELQSATLSKPLMLVTILTVSLSLIGSGFAAAFVSGRAKRSTRLSERNFELLVRGVTDYAIYMLDPEGVVSNWNAGAERAKGYTASEIVGKNFSRFYSEEERALAIPQNALRVARETGRFEAEGRRFRKDGSWFWAHVVIQPVMDDDGVLVGYAKITRDVTRQKADSDRITAVTQNLDLALENMSQGICLFDRNERLILSNARYHEIFEFPRGLVVPGLTYREIVFKGFELAVPNPSEAAKQARLYYDRSMAAIRGDQRSLEHRTRGGRIIRAVFSPIADGGWVSTFEDISEQVRSEQQIAFMAKHDNLTQLPNRAAFMSHLESEVLHADHSGERLAVIGIDLNRFKQINDQLGHSVGDAVLKVIASRMAAILEPLEIFARFGGDEFVAARRYTEIGEIHAFIERIAEEFGRTIEVEGHRLNPGASLGVALYPNDGKSPEALLANADLAMYRAKASLSHHVCFYDVGMDEAARDRTKMGKDLWTAVEEKQFHLHYQVQKSVSGGDITGYEVLLRWSHPERGNVAPSDFIPIAEECGAILPIGEWVLRQACREAASWSSDHKVAVNLSPVQIAHADMPALVHQVLLETGLQPSRLELEITETSIFSDKQRALHALRAIKAMGVSIAIDDFGTGYSSLETLQSFPFDKIKLDRSFLAEEGCHEAQGYLLGRPMPIDRHTLLREVA